MRASVGQCGRALARMITSQVEAHFGLLLVSQTRLFDFSSSRTPKEPERDEAVGQAPAASIPHHPVVHARSRYSCLCCSNTVRSFTVWGRS